MPILALVGIIQGLISSATEASTLWRDHIAPLMLSGEDITEEKVAEIHTRAAAAHAAVAALNAANATIASTALTADDLNAAELAYIAERKVSS